jgi:hypothetical protein
MSMEDEIKNPSPSEKQHVIRIRENTAQLLMGMSQRSMDAAIQLIWKSKCDQARELKEWKTVTSCKSPLEYLKKLKS